MPSPGPDTTDGHPTIDDAWFVAAYPRLRRFAAVVGPAGEDPDDLVQEALVRTMARDVAPLHLEAFLHTVILGLATDLLRRNSRWRSRLPKLVADAAHGDVYPSDLAVLVKLSPIGRAVVWLVDIEGRPYAEVGPMLGLSEQAARKHAERARRRLRAELGAPEAGP